MGNFFDDDATVKIFIDTRIRRMIGCLSHSQPPSGVAEKKGLADENSDQK
jgi:hypothetical protein